VSEALGLRDAATELWSSGDADGAAKKIEEAEAKEEHASRLIEARAAS
jgi:hypothetical protein